MTVTGFWLDRPIPGVQDELVQIRGANGTAFSEGDACIVDTSTSSNTAGLIIQAATQTTSPQYVFVTLVTPSNELRQATYNTVDSSAEFCMLYPVAFDLSLIWNTQFALATFDGTACNSNSTTNNIVFTGAGSTDDFTGGQVYVNETGQQYTVVKDSVSGGVHTFTIWPAAAVAVTTGNTIRAVPWGSGYVGGVKLQSSNPQQGISVAVADKTGGHILISSVNLATRVAYIRFSGNGAIAK